MENQNQKKIQASRYETRLDTRKGKIGSDLNRVSIHKGSEDGRLTRPTRRMKDGESPRELIRLSMIHYSIILFVIFLLVNTFFLILCRFTHISFKALDFLYFIPLFNVTLQPRNMKEKEN